MEKRKTQNKTENGEGIVVPMEAIEELNRKER